MLYLIECERKKEEKSYFNLQLYVAVTISDHSIIIETDE